MRQARNPIGPLLVSRLSVPKTVAQLEVETGLTSTLIYRAIADLENLGFVHELDRVLNGNGKRTSVYIATVQYEKNRLHEKYVAEKASDPYAIEHLIQTASRTVADLEEK